MGTHSYHLHPKDSVVSWMDSVQTKKQPEHKYPRIIAEVSVNQEGECWSETFVTVYFYKGIYFSHPYSVTFLGIFLPHEGICHEFKHCKPLFFFPTTHNICVFSFKQWSSTHEIILINSKMPTTLIQPISHRAKNTCLEFCVAEVHAIK